MCVSEVKVQREAVSQVGVMTLVSNEPSPALFLNANEHSLWQIHAGSDKSPQQCLITESTVEGMANVDARVVHHAESQTGCRGVCFWRVDEREWRKLRSPCELELTSDFIQVDIDVHGESDWEPFSGNAECVCEYEPEREEGKKKLRRS